MEVGKSPVLEAIREIEAKSSVSIRIVVSKNRFENNPHKKSGRIFSVMPCQVLIYLNLRKRTFAILSDERLSRVLSREYLSRLSHHLTEDLQSTYWENAVALAIRTIGVTIGQRPHSD